MTWACRLLYGGRMQISESSWFMQCMPRSLKPRTTQGVETTVGGGGGDVGGVGGGGGVGDGGGVFRGFPLGCLGVLAGGFLGVLGTGFRLPA